MVKTGAVEIHEFRPVNTRNAVLIDGFPSVGLVSTIAANYIIRQLDLERVAVVTSPYFPPTSVIRDGVPTHPVRVYAGKGLVVFVSEFIPAETVIDDLAKSMIEFAMKKRISMIITPEGMPVQPEDGEVCREVGSRCKAYGIASTEHMRSVLKKNSIEELSDGIITGISGMLLNEGDRLGIDVICLIAEADPRYPDARAGARLVEAIDALLPDIEIDTGPLYKEAEKIEKSISEALQRAKEHLDRHKTPASPYMYR